MANSAKFAVPSHTVCIFSDVHFTAHDAKAWSAFRKWHADTRPALTVALGDIIDLECLSRYDKRMDTTPYAVEEIQYAVKETNALSLECGRLIYQPGNHDERYEKALYGNNAMHLKGAKGLSLEDQFRAQGLSDEVRWFKETAEKPGLRIGHPDARVLCVHGHNQASGFGAKNVAATTLAKFPSHRVVLGHHHRAQVMTKTEMGFVSWCIANPHLSGPHDYAKTPDWQRGFTVLHFYGRTRLRDCKKVTPQVIVMDEDRSFCYNGKVYEP